MEKEKSTTKETYVAVEIEITFFSKEDVIITSTQDEYGVNMIDIDKLPS